MKTLKIILISLMLYGNLFALTLTEAVKLSIKNNDILKVKRIEIENKSVEEKLAKNAKLADLKINSTTKYFAGDRMVNFLSRTGESPIYNNLKSENFLVLSMPLYTGGNISSSIKISELQKQKSIIDYSATKNTIIKNTVSTFTKILESEALKKAIEKNVLSLKESRRLIQERISVGKSIKVDLLKINVRISNLNQILYEITNNIIVLKDFLKQLTGIDKINNVNLGQIEKKVSIELKTGENFELKKYYKDLETLDYKDKKIKSAKKPKVFFTTSVGGNLDSDNNFYNNNNIGLMVQYSIFDKFITKRNLKKNENSKMQLKYLIDDKTKKVNVLLKQASLRIKEIEKQIQTYNLSVKSSEETLKIEKLNYKAGKNIINDVLEAEYILLDNDQKLLHSKYSLLNARLNYYDIGGVDLESVF